MKLVTRTEWGAPSTSPAALLPSARGVKIHYLGAAYTSREHTACDDYVRGVRAAHLANEKEDWVDIAYTALVCEHGYVYEGRGLHKRSGANGNADLNGLDYAVCALLGDEGLTEPTDAMLDGLVDAIEWLRRAGGAGTYVGGHKDGWATDCPGDPLYAWIGRGAPRVSSAPATGGGKKKPGPKPVPPFPGREAFVLGCSNRAVLDLDACLIAKGFTRHNDGNGYQRSRRFTEYTRLNVADFQRSRAELRRDADGFPGPVTWRLLHS